MFDMHIRHQCMQYYIVCNIGMVTASYWKDTSHGLATSFQGDPAAFLSDAGPTAEQSPNRAATSLPPSATRRNFEMQLQFFFVNCQA
jgi:hypothetical protein